MQVKKTNSSPTKVSLTIIASDKELAPIKSHVLKHFQSRVKVPGFRAGKVPAKILEKNIDPASLQTQFLEEAIEQLYISAASQENIRPVDQPKIAVKKFVPFTTLEFEADVDILGEVKLADYKKIKLTKPDAKVTDKDVKEVIESLRERLSEKKDVARAVKSGDIAYIDFSGVDSKSKESIKGAEGKDYPLTIGSDTFIPGFEPEIIGMYAGDEKTFTITFPKDYGVKSLQSRKVDFTVSVIKVQESKLPKLDDEFAAKAGPVKTVDELKNDIRKQLLEEKQYQVDRDFESELVKKIADKSKLEIPEVLIEDQVARMWTDLQQNIMYRGQTIQEFLDQESKTEEKYREEDLKPQAQDRVKSSLVLAEIAEVEDLHVTPEELEVRMQLLKTQYTDEEMQKELEKPETRRDIAARMLTEKTVSKLSQYATE